MSESARGVVAMENGSSAVVVLREDGRYEVERMLKAAGLAGASLRDVGKFIAELPLDENGTARVDLR